jgi:putative endopeptidase
MNVEMELALVSFDQVQLQDYPSWYRVKTIDEVYGHTPNFNWRGLMRTLGLDHIEQVSFGPESYFDGMSRLLTELPLDAWKQYIRWRLISSWAFYAGEEIDAESFRFYGTVLGGSQERQERWKRVLGPINAFMGEAMGQLYVKKAFPPATKARALEMVKNLKIALRERLTNLTWMSDETKKSALKKLEAFGQKIGYPDKWRDFSGLETGQKTFFENGRAGARFSTAYALSKVGHPPDPAEWITNPQTTNAFYHPLKNEIFFPAGFLQPPFFDGEIDDAVNYGGVGMAIGHEMLHGFDNSGSRFDADGNMVNWWTDEDRELFEERTARLVEMFGAYTVADSLHVNGQLTLGENIADLGGLRIAYRALQIAREGKEDPMIDGLTQEQRFFLAYAQIWRENTTPEAIKLQVQSDPHPPAMYRVIGPLTNLKEFADAWGCKPGDKMVRKPEDRIKVW